MKQFEHLKNYDKILFVSHDAGGANLLVSIIELMDLFPRSLFVLEGPALKIFSSKFSDRLFLNHSREDLESLIKSSNVVITGTSGPDDLERVAISWCKKLNKKSYSFIDHWVNFKERFVPNSLSENELLTSFLPETIWVCDDRSKDEASIAGLPIEQIEVVGNPYFEVLKKEYAIINSPTQAGRLLFVGENFKGLGEFNYLSDLDFLDQVLSEVEAFYKNSLPINFQFFIRPHPSDWDGKYENLQERFAFVKLSDMSKSLIEDIKISEKVLGKTSMGLIISSMLGKPTYSYINKKFRYVDLAPEIIKISTMDSMLRN